MSAEIVQYEADGLAMRGELYRAKDVSGPRPGVLVFPEAFGLSDHARGRAERLSQLGYDALACDIHGDGAYTTDFDKIKESMAGMFGNPQKIRDRASGALTALLSSSNADASRVAAIGYCFGGTMALELARGGAALRGVVGFHSGLNTAAPQDAKNIKGKVLVCIGSEDPSIDAAQRAAFETEMHEGGVDWQMQVYGGVVHSFTNPEADNLGRPDFSRYDAYADAQSWSAMRLLLQTVVGA